MRFGRKGQLAIVVIIALILIGGIIIYLALQGRTNTETGEFSPIFSYYQQCISEATLNALSIAGSQGGRIDPGVYIPGSEYAPFSSQLNFLGTPVPFWYYTAGNGIIKEQVPTKSEMQGEIAQYISQRLNECDFERFYEEGYSITLGASNARVTIRDTQVDVHVDSTLTASKGSSSAQQTSYDIVVNSKFGKLYQNALKLYDLEKSSSFLEDYTVDVIRLYAPVDGVEISCSPKIWKSSEVMDNIQSALEQNIATLKFSGDDYTISDPKRKYFVVNAHVDEPARVMYSKQWPTKISISGTNGELMMAEPIGNQEGLGIMGFCYAPYHFVYDVSYPVMFQIYDGEELFQGSLHQIGRAHV